MEKVYKVDCRIHEIRIVKAENPDEAYRKAYYDEYVEHEILDFTGIPFDEWEE